MARRVVHLCANLGLAIASVALTVAVIEGSARTLALHVPFSLYPSPENCLQRSALLSQELRPHCRGILSRTNFHTNAIGLRGDEVRDDSSVRILAIGDSCTWGWRVSDDESYPARLQQLLDYRWGGGRYQVLNAGVPGTTSYQGLQLLRARGLQLRPALVIAAYGFNDASEGGDVAELIAREQKVLPLLELDDWLLDNSHAYKWARWRVWYRQKPPAQERVDVDKYVQNLADIVKVSREHGAAVIFVGFGAGPKHGPARAKVAEDLGVPLIRYKGPKLDLVHPTAEGYRDLAAEILDRLTVDGVLEQLRGVATR